MYYIDIQNTCNTPKVGCKYTTTNTLFGTYLKYIPIRNLITVGIIINSLLYNLLVDTYLHEMNYYTV